MVEDYKMTIDKNWKKILSKLLLEIPNNINVVWMNIIDEELF